jgi:hypothetical protein
VQCQKVVAFGLGLAVKVSIDLLLDIHSNLVFARSCPRRLRVKIKNLSRKWLKSTRLAIPQKTVCPKIEA